MSEYLYWDHDLLKKKYIYYQNIYKLVKKPNPETMRNIQIA